MTEELRCLFLEGDVISALDFLTLIPWSAEFTMAVGSRAKESKAATNAALQSSAQLPQELAGGLTICFSKVMLAAAA
jgi:hypothetical protein